MIEFLSDYGFLGLFLGSFLAATIIPFSSDFLIAGALIAGMDPVLSLIWASLGNWLGGLTSYWVGHLGKWRWIERWFGVSEERLFRQKVRIEKYGPYIAFFSWLPFIGDVFALGLGFYKIDFLKSAIYMLIGKTVRYLFWIFLYILLF